MNPWNNRLKGMVQMAFGIDNGTLMFLIVVIVLAAAALALRSKFGGFVKLIFKVIFGGVFIFAFNILAKHFGVFIPLNIVTSSVVGLLQLPGLLLIFFMQYLIF